SGLAAAGPRPRHQPSTMTLGALLKHLARPRTIGFSVVAMGCVGLDRAVRAVPVLGARRRAVAVVHHHVRAGARREDFDFGTLLLLGMVNQFWLHPRIQAMRAAGDQRPLRTILARRFPAVVHMELLLGMTVLFVAPFRHGSARNQAFQTNVARRGTSSGSADDRGHAGQRLDMGVCETVVLVGLMVGATAGPAALPRVT
ncbi:MAG: hypothetical protein J2P17_26180, partial [Mycobacterium sp.]|nr:hypothetical protein [Mycobacterium sp.]